MSQGFRGELLLTAAESRDLDARAAAGGISTVELVARAGYAVAAHVQRMSAHGRVLVLCGPGKNGGDGFVAASQLRESGRSVDVASLVPPGQLTGDAAKAAAGWGGPVSSLEEIDVAGASIVVDALFGTGLRRDLQGVIATTVERVNESGCPVLAVDVPTGVDSDTGEVRGVAIRAVSTVTFGTRKPGHLLLPGRDQAGRVEVADIGFGPDLIRQSGARLAANGPAAWAEQLPRPRTGGHKYDRGHAVVLSGGPSHTGAARLAARGALRAGAGLVTLATSARALPINAAHLTAVMLRIVNDPDELLDLLADDRFNALALGPGLGVSEETRAWVQSALEADRATVLDADALTSFAGQLETLAALIGAGRGRPVVLTPHEGEFMRLFPALSGSKVARAREAARQSGAVVVLKGPDTVVAAPDGWAVINENGPPHLATAGSGDVLAGMIAGLLAQGMEGFDAAAAAVWMHGDAGARFGPGLIAEDLPEILPAVWRGLLGA